MERITVSSLESRGEKNYHITHPPLWGQKVCVGGNVLFPVHKQYLKRTEGRAFRITGTGDQGIVCVC